MLVHLSGRSRALPYRLLTIEIPDDSLGDSAPLPTTWTITPAGRPSQSVGEHWLTDRQSIVFRVPSVIIPDEPSFLLNPLAPGFEKVRVIAEKPFQLDIRLAAPP